MPRAVAFATALSLVFTPAPLRRRRPHRPRRRPRTGRPRAPHRLRARQLPRPGARRRRLAARLLRPRAAEDPASTSRRSRAGTNQRRYRRLLPRCRYEAKGATEAGPGQREDRGRHEGGGLGAARRLQAVQITESNFPTLPKEQTREVVGGDRQGDPGRGARDRARPRRSRSVDKSQIVPKERRGREGRPAGDLLQPDAAPSSSNLDGEPIWSPIARERPEVRRQHQLGPLPARADEDLLPAQREVLAQGQRPQGTVDARGQAAARASPSSRPTTNWKEVKAALPGQEARRGQGAAGLREHDPGGDDPADGPAALSSRSRARARRGSATPRATSSASGSSGAGLLPRGRPLVHARRLRGPVDVRHPEPARRLPEDPASSTRARGCWPPCPARSRPPRRCCSRRCPRPRASTRRS